MNWEKECILVTGAGGFIGSHLVERLVELGARVRALVRYNSRNDWGLLELLAPSVQKRLEIIPGDVTDPFTVLRIVEGCDVIFHLAALIAIPYSYIAPRQFVEVNCLGTLNLLEAARRFLAQCSQCDAGARFPDSCDDCEVVAAIDPVPTAVGVLWHLR